MTYQQPTKTHKPLTLKDGTELPIADIKGKPYLQVAYRLVWFRKEHPDWGIETYVHEWNQEKKWVVFRSQITDETGRVVAQATKAESSVGFADYLEKAETGAIGRALALCGYGTQFEPDLDEGNRLADSPVEQVKAPTPPAPDEELF